MHSAVCLTIIQFSLMARVAATYPEQKNSIYLVKPYIAT